MDVKPSYSIKRISIILISNLQSKLLKTELDLLRNTPLLDALKIAKVTDTLITRKMFLEKNHTCVYM